MGTKPEKNEDVNLLSKDDFDEINTTKLKRLIFKIKGFLGILSCKAIKEALIKQRKYSLILKINSRYIAIFTKKKSIEIFDPLGFFRSSQPNELLNFIKAHSSKRKLVVNNEKIKKQDSLKLSLLFILLHQQINNYNKIVKHIRNKFK